MLPVNSIRYTVLFVFLVPVSVLAEEPATLATAHTIGKKLKQEGWTYGSNPAQKQIDCVQFVLKTLEEHFQMTLSADVRTRILISDLTVSQVTNDTNGIVSMGDSRTKGVQQALIDIHRGTVISLKDAKPGDFIQYWMKKHNGTWFGHAGIIEKVTEENGIRKAFLYGSHKSTEGIGTAPEGGLRLQGTADRRIYVVRAQ